MEWKPAYQVTVDGRDITSTLSPRLVSLTVDDAPGVQSDSVQLVIADHLPGQRIEIPPTGAEITVALGYGFSVKPMGVYIADSVEVSGPPDQMTIRGTAAPHGRTPSGQQPLNDQKSRSWDAETTIGDLVRKVASEHGLRAVVSGSLASIPLPHIDQVDESDINLLTRIARDFDAIAKPGGGAMIFAKRGEIQMPRVSLTPQDVTSWRMSVKLKPPAEKVVATYRDQPQALDIEAVAGAGDVVRRLRQRFPTLASAKAAADAEFNRSKRAGNQLSLTLPGNPDLVAEGRVSLSGFRDGVNGVWLVSKVQHQIDKSGGYRCSVTAEPEA